MNKKLLLLIPCFNEASRIDLGTFIRDRRVLKESGIELSFLFVNDGSSDGTKDTLEAHCKQHAESRCFHLAQNAGKGNALQRAFESIKEEADGHDWIGYWDADLATSLLEIPWMLKYLEFYDEREISSIWGSRVSRLGSVIKRQMHRHYLGRIFVTIVSMALGVKAYDSQCGAKLFTPEAARLAFSGPFISRWIFDVEILLRLKGKDIVEFPLFNWEDVPGSKVKVFKEIFRVSFDLWKIRKKYRAN